jgi:hypothetical protein
MINSIVTAPNTHLEGNPSSESGIEPSSEEVDQSSATFDDRPPDATPEDSPGEIKMASDRPPDDGLVEIEIANDRSPNDAGMGIEVANDRSPNDGLVEIEIANDRSPNDAGMGIEVASDRPPNDAGMGIEIANDRSPNDAGMGIEIANDRPSALSPDLLLLTQVVQELQALRTSQSEQLQQIHHLQVQLLATSQPEPPQPWVSPRFYRAPIAWFLGRVAQRAKAVEKWEWEKALDHMAIAMENWGLLKIMAAAGNLALLVAVVTWIWGRDDRLKQKHYQAWGVINSSASISPRYQDYPARRGQPAEQRVIWGSTGEGGRTKAIEELHSDGQSLAGLQAPGAYLVGLDVQQQGSLGLKQIPCWPWLPIGCIPKADFANANLEGSRLGKAQFQGADLYATNLKGAVFWGANLQGADLKDSLLQFAYLEEANLSKTNLIGADLRGAVFISTRFDSATQVRPDQFQGAYVCNLQVPKDFGLNPDRDCEILPTILSQDFGWRFPTGLKEAKAYLQQLTNPSPSPQP